MWRELELNPTVNLSSSLVNTANPGNLANFDTSTAINRTNPLNMVASQTILNVDNVLAGQVYISTSMDAGFTWSDPFLLTSSPGGFDSRGLIADQFGNFWYALNQLYYGIPGLYIYTSCTGGSTWNDPIFVPVPADIFGFDYPQLAVGNNGSGDYGLFIQVDQVLANEEDIQAQIYFFATTGLGSIQREPSSSHVSKFESVLKWDHCNGGKWYSVH